MEIKKAVKETTGSGGDKKNKINTFTGNRQVLPLRGVGFSTQAGRLCAFATVKATISKGRDQKKSPGC